VVPEFKAAETRIVAPTPFPEIPSRTEQTQTIKPRLFIVHGQNEGAKLSLKNYLQNTLKLPEPIVLHEQLNLGRTVAEKLEHFVNQSDGAIVVLTPDDHWIDSGTNEELRRARQNVIFELGYFYGKFGRTSGRVILLYQGVLDIPSDLAGVAYIDISYGVEAAGEQIRRELGL
jgi:predicted nucleotide-binding protein